jgi:phage gp29-like protein
VQVSALEFKQSSAESFAQAVAHHNAEIAKSILGETLTTDEGQRVGSLALGQVHLKVLQTQLRALRAELVRLNFGDAPVPRFVWEED